MYRYNDEIEIDLKDLIAEILTKWLYILLCCVLVATLMLGYAFVKDIKLAKVVPAEERIAAAKEPLSVEEAETVERVFQQYKSYTQYKESLQKYYNDYLFTGDDFSDYVAEDVVFCVSTNVYGADSVISKLSLSPEVYEKIRSVLPEDEAIATIYKRVTITSTAKNSITLLNDDEDGVFLPNEYIFTLSIVAKTQEQCNKIEAIVSESIEKQFDTIKGIDEKALLTKLGSNYSENLADWLMGRQTEAINNLNNVENTIKNFNNNQVNNLSEGQKKYYNVLLETQKEDSQNAPKTSKLKYLIVGIFGGGIISCGYILLKYLFDTTIKTEGDISSRYNIPVLKSIVVEKRKTALFDKVVRMLRNIQEEDNERALDLAATDIKILMDKTGTEKLYIVETSDSNISQEIAAHLRKKLVEEKENKSVLVGAPVINPEAMIDMSKSDNVILLVETKKTKQISADKSYELFERFNSNVLGAIVIKRA